MPKAKKPSKPKSDLSKVERARRALISNAPNTDRKTLERQKAALEQAKLEVEANKAYKKAFRMARIQAAKQAGRADALRDAQKQQKKKK